MALLLLRHALSIGQGDGDEDDLSTFFSVSVIEFRSIEYYNLQHLFVIFTQLYCCLLAAFLAPSCWLPSSLLHYGLGYQYSTAA